MKAIVGPVLGAVWILSLVLAAAAPATAYRRPGTTELISATPDGRYGGGGFYSFSALSGDGRYVAFDHVGSDLVPRDLNPSLDVFVRDRTTDTTKLVSVDSRGLQAIGGGSQSPVITANGRYVAFESTAPNLVVGDLNLATDVFVRDLKTGETTRASVDSQGRESRVPRHNSFQPSVSNDGRYVAFASFAPDLVPDDTNGLVDLFLHDRVAHRTTRLSVAPDGSEAVQTGPGPFFSTPGSICPSISPNGRWVAFSSTATNLVPGDTNVMRDVFVLDRNSGNIRRVSVASDGSQAGPTDPTGLGSTTCGASDRTISDDGRFVAFASHAQNLVPVDTTGNDDSAFDADIFVHDTKTGRTERVTVASSGREANSTSWPMASISGNGRYVAYASHATNLFEGDTDMTVPTIPSFGSPMARDLDVFVHDRNTGVTDVVSVGDDGGESRECIPTHSSWRNAFLPAISRNGRSIAFSSCSANITPGDSNDSFDLFVRDIGPDLGIAPMTPGASRALIAAGRNGRSRTVRLRDDPSDSGGLEHGAELLGATIVLRDSDLYVKIDVDRIPGPRGGLDNAPAAGNPAIVYGVNLEVNGAARQVRIGAGDASRSVLGTAFGLFACDHDAPCTEVSTLEGGLGTVGESVVVAVPLDELGLEAEGSVRLDNVFSAYGTYQLGATRIIDTAS